MPVRVETDTVIFVPAFEPGSDKPESVELREADRPGSVAIHGGRYGSEVSIPELREALDHAERAFAPSLRSA
jgi:hypothetical protein